MGVAEQLPSRELARRNGRDEMNLAEFPITLLADRTPRGQKTLVFRDGIGYDAVRLRESVKGKVGSF